MCKRTASPDVFSRPAQDDTYFALAEYKYKYRDQLMGDDRIK